MVSKGKVEVVAAAEAERGAEAVAAAVTCVLVVLCCLLGARYLRQRHQYWRRRGVPCPPATPLLGHTLARMGLTRPFTEFFDELYYDYNGRDYCGFYDFLKPGLFVGNPQLIKTILVQDFQYFADRRTFDLAKVSPVANDMLTNARGTHWRRIRSAVSPAFTKNRTRRLYPLLLQRASHFLRLVRSIKQDQQEQQDQLTPAPMSTIRDATEVETVRGTVMDATEPGLSGADNACVDMSKENVKQRPKYSKKRTGAGASKEEDAMERTIESKENEQESKYFMKRRGAREAEEDDKEIRATERKKYAEQGSNYSRKMKAPEEAPESIITQTKELGMSAPQGKRQQTIATRTTATTTVTGRTAKRHTAHTKHKQIDPQLNEELRPTSPATDTGNTRVATPATHTQQRDEKHDTNNNSTRRSTATEVDTEAQTDKKTHLMETNTAATTPRRRNTATATDTDAADGPATRHKGGEKPTQEELKRKDDIEARRVCGRYTMDAIASCAFGLECEALDKEAALFPIMAARVFQLSPTRALKMLLVAVSPKAAQLASAAGLRYTSEEFTFFLRVAKHALAARRAARTPRGDFLDLLLEATAQSKQGLSDDTLAAQTILFLLAGYDNTANTLAMSLHLLAHHPPARARLRRELACAVLKSGSSSGRLSYEEVTELPYLDAVVCETLRLYPAAPVIERVCTEPCRLGGVEVEVGTGVVVPVWCLHRDPAHWPRPHHFMPERFLREARQSHTPFTYLPFGAGPRSCVGVRFAQVVVKAALAALLSGADVIPSPASPYPTVLDPRVLTLQPKNGLYVSFKPSPLPDMLKRELEEYPPLCAEDEAVAVNLHQLLALRSGQEANIEKTDGLRD